MERPWTRIRKAKRPFENDFEYEDVEDVGVLRRPDLEFQNHIPGPIALFTNFFVLTSHWSIILKKKL